MAGGAKEHVDKIKTSKFNRQRAETSVLRANTGSDGYVFCHSDPSDPGNVTAAGQCEFHHVLPISSLQDAAIRGGKKDENLDFVHKCMAKTTWDINEQPNMLGLPTKGPFEDADGKAAKGQTLAALVALNPMAGNFGSLPNLPCHLNDHDKFTAAVIDKFNAELWPELIEQREECKDRGKSIRALLRSHSNDWKSFLKTRGGEHGGAADCWVNRETKKSVWYIPLSMAPDPRKSDPPPNVHKRGAMTVRAWLEKIFSWGG